MGQSKGARLVSGSVEGERTCESQVQSENSGQAGPKSWMSSGSRGSARIHDDKTEAGNRIISPANETNGLGTERRRV